MSAALQLPSSFDGIAAIAWTLEPPDPREKKDVLRDEAGFLLDGLLVRVARSQGALDVAIGELLADVGTGDRALRLGFSRVGDYSRERLGIAASTAQKLVRLAVGLRDLEEETRNWEFLETIAPVPAPAEFICDGLVALCPAHHLHGVPKGWLRVSGRAPGGLTWVFKNGGGPRVAGNAAAWSPGCVAGGAVIAMA